MNRIHKVIYNLSALVPFLFIFSLVWYIKKNDYIVSLGCIGAGVLLSILLWASFSYGKKHLAPITIRVSDISPNDGCVIVYIITYIFPLLDIAIDKSNLIVVGVITLILCLLIPSLNSSLPNPLLLMGKYHFYKVSGKNGISGYTFISKKRIRRNQDLKNVKRLFDFLVLDAEE